MEKNKKKEMRNNSAIVAEFEKLENKKFIGAVYVNEFSIELMFEGDIHIEICGGDWICSFPK